MNDADRLGGAEAPEAIRILWREHANIFRVLTCLEELVADEAEPLDIERLSAILDYMAGYGDVLHHPKEEHYLLPAMLRRKPDLALLIQKIQEEHDDGAAAMTDLCRVLSQCPGDAGAQAHFRALAKDYAEFQKRHMAREDRGLLPVALEILTSEDMAVLTLAFTRAEDPLIGLAHQAEFQELFEHIVSRRPAEARKAAP